MRTKTFTNTFTKTLTRTSLRWGLLAAGALAAATVTGAGLAVADTPAPTTSSNEQTVEHESESDTRHWTQWMDQHMQQMLDALPPEMRGPAERTHDQMRPMMERTPGMPELDGLGGMGMGGDMMGN